jgi:hypothetical protein
MRIAIAAALAAGGLSTPALATGGLLCKPIGAAEPALSLVIGHSYAPNIVCANLRESGRWLSTCSPNDAFTVARSWLDRQRVWVYIIDQRNGREQAKLRAVVQPDQRIHTAIGSLTRRGKTYKVRCVEG